MQRSYNYSFHLFGQDDQGEKVPNIVADDPDVVEPNDL